MAINLKELSKQPEGLAQGHRMCMGCGVPIGVRQVLFGTKKPIVVASATGCLEVCTTIYPYTSWKVPFIHNAFENSAATMSGVEAAFHALSRKGRVDKDIKFVAFGGDGGTYDIGLQSLSGMLERGHDVFYVCYDNEGYMNCLSRDSLIMTEAGLKRITDVLVGERVYAFNQKDGSAVLKRCTGVFDNGIKAVYELSTLHHSIKATSNHPFLVVKRGKAGSLIWKTIAELKPGDEVIVQERMMGEKSHRFQPIKESVKGDYKVNKINRLALPSVSSPALMELLGLYVGDGWTREA